MDRILSLWPSLAALATDLGLPYQTVAAWRQRGSVPAKHDLALVRAAERREIALTLADIATARAGQPPQLTGAAE